MPRAKIAITLDEDTLRRVDLLVQAEVYPNRSQAIQAAIDEKLDRLDRGRLARECSLLDPVVEKAMADEGLAADRDQWPEY